MTVYRFARTMQLGKYDGDEIITVQMARVTDADCGIAAFRLQMIGQKGEIIAETAIGGGNPLGAQAHHQNDRNAHADCRAASVPDDQKVIAA